MWLTHLFFLNIYIYIYIYLQSIWSYKRDCNGYIYKYENWIMHSMNGIMSTYKTLKVVKATIVVISNWLLPWDERHSINGVLVVL